MKKVEILSPCGSFDSLKAAISAKADAVYLGGSSFGARAYAGNFDKDELLQAIKYAHLYGTKVYLTVNTLFKNDEIYKLYDFLAPYYEAGLDAVIVQDLGVLNVIHSCFKDIDIHASTQLSTTGIYGAKLLKELGVKRIVTAREINLSEIKAIHDNVEIEIESFVHGAMCYSYSGQCLLSSFIGDRSGNRGRCAGSCRLPYEINGNDTYLLSLKDMATLAILPDIIDAGVYSLKIEGRMKNPEYCAFVTSMYKKYSDLYLKYGREKYNVSEEDYRDLLDIFNRGNFTTGFYNTQNSKDMMSFDRPNHKGILIGEVIKKKENKVTLKLLEDVNSADVIDVHEKYEYTLGQGAKKNEAITLNVSGKSPLKIGDKLYRTRNNKLINSIKELTQTPRKLSINGIFTGKIGEYPSLTLYKDDDYAFYQSNEKISQAINKSIQEEDIKKNICKTGNTEFVIDDLSVDISENIFMPVKVLNEMRRACIENLKNTITDKYIRTSGNNLVNNNCTHINNDTFYTLQVESEEGVKIALDYPWIKIIYLESYGVKNIDKLLEICHKKDKLLYIALPYVCRKNSYEAFKYNCDGYLVRNHEELGYIREKKIDKPIVFDYNMYSYNNEAISYYNQFGTATCGLELSFEEAKTLNFNNLELIVYGVLPMMITASCINKNTSGCDKKSKCIEFRDRFDNTFYAKNICSDCYNVIYNYRPLAIYDREEDIKTLSPKSLRIIITSREEENMKELLNSVYNHKLNLNEYTRGHFYKNIL